MSGNLDTNQAGMLNKLEKCRLLKQVKKKVAQMIRENFSLGEQI